MTGQGTIKLRFRYDNNLDVTGTTYAPENPRY